MTSYLKRWRTARPRVGGGAASEEWEELSSRLSEASDREEEDAVVVASASSFASPPAKAEASPPEPTFEEEDDTHPFALLRLRIRPASVAFWVRKPALLHASTLGQRSPRARAAPVAPQRCARSAPLLARSSRLHCACRAARARAQLPVRRRGRGPA